MSNAKRTIATACATLSLAALLLAPSAQAATAPALSVEDASSVSSFSAHVSGTVDPGGKTTNWRFEYITDPAYQVHRDEEQKLTVSATVGTYTLTAIAAKGSGITASGSEEVSGLFTQSGAFRVGDAIAGAGIPPATTIAEVTPTTLKLSAAATTSGRAALTASETSGPIAFGASASGVQTALEALPAIGAGNLSVGGGPGDETGSSPYSILFGGALANRNVEQLSAQSAGLVGGKATATVQTPIEGRSVGFEGATSGPSGSTSTAAAVEGQFSLRPTITYHLALAASNEVGETFLEAAHTFTAPAAPPGVATGPNTPFPGGKVHLLGYVDPEQMPVTSCKFVYGPAENDYTAEAPCANHPGNEIQALGVGAIGGQYKLKFEGETTVDLPYNASAAEVQSALEALPAIGANGVSVKQVVEIPDYRRYWVSFEGPLADRKVEALRHETGTEPLQVNEPEQSVNGAVVVETLDQGGLGGAHEVTAELSGLTPGAVYHYRLVAENGAGKAESSDAVFKAAQEESKNCTNAGALGTSFLPECRAWEMVSPPDKNGGDILALSNATRVASDGSAATFASPSPFADASGAGIASEYQSVRSAAGWQTHGILPRQPPGTFSAAVEALIPHYMGEFSGDLGTGIFFAIKPLDESEPNVEAVVNLYLREDLRTPGEGSYRLLTGCPLCAEKSPSAPLKGYAGELAPWVVAASADFKHVIFESELNMAKGAASPVLKLYESEAGTVRLVGILPNGAAALESSAAGPHFPNQPPHNVADTVSSDGSHVVWTDGTNLYLRLDHETTIQLNESELSPSEGDGTAQFQDATPSGSKVFFTDGARLSEDAPKGGGLYAYDTTKPPSDPHNLSFIAALSVNGDRVFGVSANGDTAYLEARGGNGEEELFVWHNGQIRLVGALHLYDIRNERITPQGQLLFGEERQPGALQAQYPGYCPATGGRQLCVAFYSYDPGTEALQCVTCVPAGQGLQGVTPGIAHSGEGGGANYRRENHPISTDGKHVFFHTNAALSPEDTNGVSDVYAFNTATSEVSLISRGTDASPSYFMEATPDGSNVLFTTRQRLSGWDFDRSVDLYDARVNGGLPEPSQSSAICESIETCHGSAAQPPNREPTSSESLLGPGNPPPPHPRTCPKGRRPVTIKGRRRCVKKRSHHHRRLGGRK